MSHQGGVSGRALFGSNGDATGLGGGGRECAICLGGRREPEDSGSYLGYHPAYTSNRTLAGREEARTKEA
eukprot:14984339-Heterocapsa_arctica.AAC.1